MLTPIRVKRHELQSADLPLMLKLAEDTGQYSADVTAGGGSPGTQKMTKFKTWVDDGKTWNYDYHDDGAD